MRFTKNIRGWRYRLAVISLPFLMLLLSGCATKQDVLRVEEKVNQVRNDQKLLKAQLNKIDSLITGGIENENRLRVEMRTALDETGARLTQIENQLRDLQQLVYRLAQHAGGETGLIQPPVIAEKPVDSTGADSGTYDTSMVSSVDCRRLWDNAFKDMYRGQHDLAISGFSDYLKYCPNGDLSDNSQYWIAEAYYEMRQFERAIEEYKKVLDNYPDSEKRATAYFKLGRCYEDLGDKKKALEYFLILRNDYPGTVEFEQVRDKIEAWEKEPKN